MTNLEGALRDAIEALKVASYFRTNEIVSPMITEALDKLRAVLDAVPEDLDETAERVEHDYRVSNDFRPRDCDDLVFAAKLLHTIAKEKNDA